MTVSDWLGLVLAVALAIVVLVGSDQLLRFFERYLPDQDPWR